jgi:ATP/maltotriose-dependent transcriptional regulator MalT
MKAFNTSTALVVLRKAIQSIAQQQFDTAEGLLDRYETKLGRQRHVSCLARAVIAVTRGEEDQAQTLTQRAGVLLHAHQGVTGVERDVLIYLVRQLESIATGGSWLSLERIRNLLGDDAGKGMGAEKGDSRSA